jgi:hypothetical protein
LKKLQALGWVRKATGAPFYEPLGHISQVHEDYFYGELVAGARVRSHPNNQGNSTNNHNAGYG